MSSEPVLIQNIFKEAAETPLWITIVGWVVAILCSLISSGRSKRKRKNEKQKSIEEFESFKKEIRNQITHELNGNLFHENKPEIIKMLNHCLVQIDQEHFTGRETFNQLQNAMVKARSLAEIRKFSKSDMKVISNFTQFVCDSAYNDEKDWIAFSQKIPEIIIIFQKGEY